MTVAAGGVSAHQGHDGSRSRGCDPGPHEQGVVQAGDIGLWWPRRSAIEPALSIAAVSTSK
jgi:hypothetical protein